MEREKDEDDPAVYQYEGSQEQKDVEAFKARLDKQELREYLQGRPASKRKRQIRKS